MIALMRCLLAVVASLFVMVHASHVSAHPAGMDAHIGAPHAETGHAPSPLAALDRQGGHCCTSEMGHSANCFALAAPVRLSLGDVTRVALRAQTAIDRGAPHALWPQGRLFRPPRMM